MYACLAVTCHLHFWQNDRDLLRATAVGCFVVIMVGCFVVIVFTWVGKQIPKLESAQKVDPGEENSPAAPAGI